MDVIPIERLFRSYQSSVDMLPNPQLHQKLDKIASRIPVHYHTSYHRVQSRLDSFTNWPSTRIVTPQALAEAGFIYQNHRDIVHCVFCLGGIRNWEEGDTAMGEHRRHNPHCPYIMAFDIEQGTTHNASSQDRTEDNTHARAEDILSCKVCLDSDIQCLFLPCRHVVCCERCSGLISKCVLCKSDIHAVLKVLLS